MAKFSVDEIAKAVKGRIAAGRAKSATGVVIDSRHVRRGCVFFAIIGERLDGHQFVADAFAKGAAIAVVSDEALAGSCPGKTLIVVEDTTRALQDLAAHHRRRFKKLLVVGVTGSNGKTTVKDMVAAALSQKYKTLKTEGNLNNHIGVPMTLFNLTEKHEAAVIEMGMNNPGEIARLTQIAAPSIGVITNIGPAHIGRLGSIDAVRRAKGEIIVNLPKNGVAALNLDDENSAPLIEARERKTITFGRNPSANISLVDTWTENGTRTAVVHDGKTETELRIPLLGLKAVDNALAAFAAATCAKVASADIAKGIAKVKPAKMRMEPSRLPNGALLVNDAYNANPQSLEAALMTLATMRVNGGRLIFVFGDMLELGGKSAAMHKAVGKITARLKLDEIYTHGEMAALACDEAGKKGVAAYPAKSHEDIAMALAKAVRPSDIILVKGSRSMAMENVARRLVELMEK